MNCSCGSQLRFVKKIKSNLIFVCEACSKAFESKINKPSEIKESKTKIDLSDIAQMPLHSISIKETPNLPQGVNRIVFNSPEERTKVLSRLEIDMINELSAGIISGDRIAQKLFCDILEREEKKKKKYFSPDDYSVLIKDILRPPSEDYLKEIAKMLKQEDIEEAEAAPMIAANIHKLSFFYRIEYLPHAKQLICHLSNKRFKIIAAGARAGKSMLAGAEAAFLFIIKPDARIWCVSSQYELAEKEFDWALNFLSKLKLKTKDNASLLEYCNLINPKKGGREINASWGSFIRTKSTDKPSSLLGEELDMVILGEASQVPSIAWTRYLRARIGPRQGVLYAVSTPNSDAGLFMDLYKRGISKASEWDGWEGWQFPTIANPHFSQEEYNLAKNELDAKIFQEQYEGKFVSRKGFVFGNITEIVITENRYPEDIYSYVMVWSAVYNYNKPAVALLMALAPKDRKYYILKELYLKNSLPAGIISIMKEASKGLNVKGIIVGKKDYVFQDELKAYGLSYVFDSEAKINENQALTLKIMNLKNLIESYSILISAENKELIREMEAMKWSATDDEGKNNDIPDILQAPLALANATTFWDIARGIDVYKIQQKKDIIDDDIS